MKIRTALPLALAAAASLIALAPDEEPRTGARPSRDVTVADLAWLAGSWTGSDGQSEWESSYSSPAGGQIVAASKEMRGGETVMIDFEHFYERDGEVRMTPFPFGKKSVEFALSEYSGADQRAVFANPEHDFPKTFVYHRVDRETLKVTLDGEMNGAPLRVELVLTPRE